MNAEGPHNSKVLALVAGRVGGLVGLVGLGDKDTGMASFTSLSAREMDIFSRSKGGFWNLRVEQLLEKKSWEIFSNWILDLQL